MVGCCFICGLLINGVHGFGCSWKSIGGLIGVNEIDDWFGVMEKFEFFDKVERNGVTLGDGDGTWCKTPPMTIGVNKGVEQIVLELLESPKLIIRGIGFKNLISFGSFCFSSFSSVVVATRWFWL